jgi:hypothetical protein
MNDKPNNSDIPVVEAPEQASVDNVPSSENIQAKFTKS